MALATAAADGQPSVRMVLLKAADESGFTFFTNYASRKGRDLAENPHAALLFHRPGIQVRVEGARRAVTPEESDAYWATRPAHRGAARRHRASRSRSARARSSRRRSPRSRPSRRGPTRWGGFRLTPERYEFWRHRDDRLHERHLFVRRDGDWHVVLLQP